MVPQKSETKALILLSSLPSVFPPDKESGSEKVAVKHPHIPVFVRRLAHVPNSGILIRDSQKDAKTRPRQIVNARVHNLIKTKEREGRWKELFFWLPIEELIQSRQKEYYDALAAADKQADSAGFVELILEIIRDSLKEVTVVGRSTGQDSDQVTDQDKTPTERLLSVLGNDTLSAAELMERLGLSHRPTFRKNYLNPALEQNLIERTIPDKPNSKNQKYRKRFKVK